MTERDYQDMLANLTATQTRCNELLEEARAARRELKIQRVVEGALRLHAIHLEMRIEALEAELSSR